MRSCVRVGMSTRVRLDESAQETLTRKALYMQRLKQNRLILQTSEKPYLKYFSPVTALNLSYNVLCLQHFSRGRLLDAGAGHLQNRQLAAPYCDRYESMDISPVVQGLDHIADVQDMSGIPNDEYDTVLLTHVLEHLPRPGDALAECRRILSPGGVLIGSTPHLSRLHGEPHDYFRFTKYGLAHLLGQVAGFKRWAVFPAGGLLTFLGHQFSTLFVCGTLHIPIAGRLLARFNHAVNIPAILWLDRRIGAQATMACMYFFLAANGNFTPEQEKWIRNVKGVMTSEEGR